MKRALDTDNLESDHSKRNKHELEEGSTFTCRICEVTMAMSAFSRSQLKRLLHKKISSAQLSCSSCASKGLENELNASRELKLEKNRTKVMDKAKDSSMGKIKQLKGQKSKSSDPSLLYIKDPLKTPIIADAKQFFEGLETDYVAQVGPKEGWRTVAKLAVRKHKHNNSVCIGLFQPGSHTIDPSSDSCEAHHPSINRAVKLIAASCGDLEIQGYDEISSTGQLRYLTFGVDRSTGQVQLTLVWNTVPYGGNKMGDHMLRKLVHKLSAISLDESSSSGDTKLLFHSIWANFHPVESYVNTITSRELNNWLLMYPHGDSSQAQAIPQEKSTGVKKSKSNNKQLSKEEKILVEEEKFAEFYKKSEAGIVFEQLSLPFGQIDSKKVKALSPMKPLLRFPPCVFRQANLDGFTKIIKQIRNYLAPCEILPEHPKIIELYGGVGTIGLNCLDLCSTLICSDENPHNNICFTQSRVALEDSYHSTAGMLGQAEYITLSAAAMVEKYKGMNGFNVCIVDPPRKGLDKEVLDALTTPLSSSQVVRSKKSKKNDSSTHSATTVPNRLIYISCGFKAFKRDCMELLGNDTMPTDGLEKSTNRVHWKLVRAEGHVLFPGADHVETMAVFDRIL